MIVVVSLITVATRMIDSPMMNLSTVAALALFSGTVVRHPLGFLLPLLIRGLTDVFVHLQTGYGFFPSWPFDYSAYVLIYFLGILIPRTPIRAGVGMGWRIAGRTAAVLGGSGAAVLVYFLLSNFGVWLIWPDTYAHTTAGLIDCFTKAIPFVRGTILGNLVAAPLFYGAWYCLAAVVPVDQRLAAQTQ